MPFVNIHRGQQGFSQLLRSSERLTPTTAQTAQWNLATLYTLTMGKNNMVSIQSVGFATLLFHMLSFEQSPSIQFNNSPLFGVY
jgi:hypothetical protein